MTIFLLINRAMVQDLPPNATPDVNQPAANFLLAGAFCTLIIPALVTWSLLSPIDSTYRRGGLSMVSGFGAIMVSLLGVPFNEFAGQQGLVGLLVGSLILALLIARKVFRERRIVG
ncbi:MAG: hypothetical protein ABI679_08070 [Gemmatimonadota bacterium]